MLNEHVYVYVWIIKVMATSHKPQDHLDSDILLSPGHPPKDEAAAPPPGAAGFTSGTPHTSATPEPAPADAGERPGGPRPKKRRTTKQMLAYNAVVSLGLRSGDALLRHAAALNATGDGAILDFLHSRDAAAFVAKVWWTEEAAARVTRSSATRMDLLRAAAEWPCVCGGELGAERSLAFGNILQNGDAREMWCLNLA